MTLAFVVLLLFLELTGYEVHVEQFFLSLKQVIVEVFVVWHSLTETTGDILPDHVDKVMVCHHGMDIESINIIQVLFNCTCLLEMTNVVKSPLRLIMVAIVFSNGMLNLFPSIKPMLVKDLPFQCICSYRLADIGHSFYHVASLYDGEEIFHQKNPSLQVLHVS